MRIRDWAAVGTGALALGAYAALGRRQRLDLRGRSVLITGGSRGLGLLLARAFGAEGARLTLMARDADELERARDELATANIPVQVVVGDVSVEDDARRAVARAVATYGSLDVLVNNAGVIKAGPLDCMELADFEEAMAVHFWGPLHMTMAALPQLRQQGGGRIVMIASIGGKLAVPHLLPYSASKFALVGLSDGLRAELARDNIFVTTVSPGLMRTGSHMNAQFKGQHKKEFSLFALVDALPITSIDGGRAARQIVAACRDGAPQLVITWQARSIVLAQALLPGLTASITRLVNRVLPSAPAAGGQEARSGWESRTWLAPSALTSLADRATAANNEIPGRWEDARR
jgi:NAD(P)-dependent dehydrogenase (short-subunit alcohol dehydrogenase family)